LPLRAPLPPQASCDGGRAQCTGAAGARVGGTEAAACELSSRAAVAGQGRLRLRRGSRLLAAAARVGSECVSE
jgi:hypothetical protein